MGWGDGGGSGKGWQEALLCELPRIISQQSRNLHTHWFPHQLLSFWNQEKKRRAGRAAEECLIPSSASVLALLSQNHAQALPPLPPHQPMGTSQLSGQGAEAPGGEGVAQDHTAREGDFSCCCHEN